MVHIVNEEVSGIDEEVIIVNTKEKTVKVDVNNMIEETAASVIKEVSVEEMSDVDNVEEKIIVDHAKEDVLVNEENVSRRTKIFCLNLRITSAENILHGNTGRSVVDCA